MSSLAEKLATNIKLEIQNEFAEVHFSENLVKTIKVYKSKNGQWCIEIPAQVYNLKLYKKEHVIVYEGADSYAQKIDKTGGFSRKHKNYVEKCIERAINKTLKENNVKGSYTIQ